MRINLLSLCLISLFALISPCHAADRYNVASPDGRVMVRFGLEDGSPTYSVKLGDTTALARSRMGVIVNGKTHEWELRHVSRSKHDSTWEPVWGTTDQVRNHYRQARFQLEAPDGTRMNIAFRVFDDGLGFCYEWPAQDELQRTKIDDELTSFNFSGDHQVWWVSTRKASDGGRLSKFPGGTQSPVTVQVAQDCWVSIHEADVRDYGLFRVYPIQGETALGIRTNSLATTPHRSPWRTLMVVDRPGKLVTSHLIENLNPPCAIETPSWIQPGKSLWDWRNRGATVDGFTYGLGTQTMKRLIDFAAEENFQYALVDSGWYGPERKDSSDPTTHVDSIDIPWLAKYAKSKGVGLWLYLNDEALKQYDLEKTFSTYEDWGVVGIKHGFVHGSPQEKVSFTRKVVEACARHHLMYVPHEPAKPWGLHREYPNYMASEFVNALYDGPGRPAATPTYMCILPFTNNLVGPLDRNCGMFALETAIQRDKVHKEALSTVVSQLAQCLTVQTGYLCVPDHPEAYRAKPDLLDFLSAMPVTWDETKVLTADVGNYVTIARRHGEEWFVASLTNEEGRALDISLSFLSKGKYSVKIYRDGPDAHFRTNRESYAVEQLTADNEDIVEAKLAPGGGHCMWIRSAD